MFVRRFVLLGFLYFFFLTSFGVERIVSVNRGGILPDSLKSDTAWIYSTLKVKGPISPSDVDFIAKICRANEIFKTIDLSAVYGLSKINWGSFQGCSNIVTIILPDDLDRIGDFAFANCPQLSGVKFPKKLTSIGSSAFLGCLSLTNIELPSSLILLCKDAFRECSNLKKIIFDGNFSIAQDAFRDCSLLSEIYCKSIVPPLCSDDAFSDVNYRSCHLFVPASSLSMYNKNKVWKKFKSISSYSSH